jgi:hypothetical protein
MKQKSSTEAILTLMQDAQQFKRVNQWRKAAVEIYSDYIDAEYRETGTIRAIPENNADEWRIFASGDEIVIVFTYYYEDEDL